MFCSDHLTNDSFNFLTMLMLALLLAFCVIYVHIPPHVFRIFILQKVHLQSAFVKVVVESVKEQLFPLSFTPHGGFECDRL